VHLNNPRAATLRLAQNLVVALRMMMSRRSATKLQLALHLVPLMVVSSVQFSSLSMKTLRFDLYQW
jgi:hypothetical protein